MRITFWGVRGSVPVPGPNTVRYGGNTPCVTVEAEPGLVVILDAGTGIRPLGKSLMSRLDRTRLVLLSSHLHWDHIQGLPFFQPLYDPRTRLDIYAGAYQARDPAEALAAQMVAPFFPVNWPELPADIRVHAIGEGRFALGDLMVTAATVEHSAPSLGFRLEYGGRCVVYTGDREGGVPGGAESETLAQLCAGADLLITDAQYSGEEYDAHRGWGHSSLAHALALGAEAAVGHLVLFHHDPERSDDELDQWAEVMARQARGPQCRITLAYEGLVIDL